MATQVLNSTAGNKTAIAYPWHDCYYAEYAIGGLAKRNDLRDVRTFALNGVRSECYRSVFLFDEGIVRHASQQSPPSVRGYKGRCVSDNLIVDFDAPDYFSMEETKKEVIRFVSHLTTALGVPSNCITVAYSGNRGFHVSIPTPLLALHEPSDQYVGRYQEVAKTLTKGFRYTDASVYTANSLMRMMNTKNQKADLFKVPLSFDELAQPMEQILRLADNPRPYHIIDPTTLQPVAEAITSIEAATLPTDDHVTQTVPSDNRPSIDELWMHGAEKTSRNAALTRLAGQLIASGMTQTAAQSILSDWNRNRNTPPLDQGEVDHTVRKQFGMYGKQAGARPHDSPDATSVRTLADIAADFKPRLAEGDAYAVWTGIPSLDRQWVGLGQGQVLCLLARSGVGKSAFAQHMLQNYMQSTSAAAVFFSFEMSAKDVLLRACQMETGRHPMELLEVVKNSGGDLPLEMREVAEKFARLLIVDNLPPTIDTVRQCVHSAEKKLEVKVRLILIDYVQVMRHKSRSIYDDLSFVAKELKSVAKELDVAVIVLSQLPNAFNEHTEPTMASSRDSGVIVEAADNVLALWLRDGESADRVRMNARFIKCRHGGGGKPVPIIMDRTSLRFTADSSAAMMANASKRRPYVQYTKQ